MTEHERWELIMLTKREIEQQIAEIKMDYINLQGDIEKLENTGHIDSVMQAEERLARMEILHSGLIVSTYSTYVSFPSCTIKSGCNSFRCFTSSSIWS